MAEISCENLCFNYSVYSQNSKNFKNSIFNLLGLYSYKEPAITQKVALDNVSFVLNNGDKLGVFGLNGAGKTTLLKLICGIFAPSSGRLTTRGKIASTISLTQGMLPDATIVENIKLRLLLSENSYETSAETIDGALDFVGLLSVKNDALHTLSTGMVLKVAYACMMCQEPDVLVMDEFINAGDAAFKAKLNQDLQDRINNSSIFILTSHDEQIILENCNRGLVLHRGNSTFFENVNDARMFYHRIVEEH